MMTTLSGRGDKREGTTPSGRLLVARRFKVAYTSAPWALYDETDGPLRARLISRGTLAEVRLDAKDER